MLKSCIAIVAIILSGCATNLKQEVGRLEADNVRLRTSIQNNEGRVEALKATIEAAQSGIARERANVNFLQMKKLPEHKSSLDESRAYLASSEGRTIYFNKQCILPPHGSKPKPFCESRQDAREFALAYCAMPLGCDAAMALADNKLDSFSKRFLMSEACARSVAALQGEGYSADQTLVNALESATDSLCNDSGFWAAVGCLANGMVKISKAAAYLDCIDTSGDRCYRNAVNWKETPKRRQHVCMEHIDNIEKRSKEVAATQEIIQRSLKSLDEYQARVPSARAEIATLEKQLKKDYEQNTRNNAQIKEIKSSVLWSLGRE